MWVFVGTLLVFLLVMAVLMWVKTPHYMMSKEDVVLLFQKVLVGQASENDWAIFLSSSFRHFPALEQVRLECLILDDTDYIESSTKGFLLTERGLDKLRQLLFRVENLDDS
jgi:hypothetical protein